MLLEKYGGDVPKTVDEMMELKGVGPKMAFLCANECYKEPVGIGVDVHVHRISNRLGWVETNKPEETRLVKFHFLFLSVRRLIFLQALEKWLPKDKWIPVNFLLVGFGQTICRPVGPKCAICPVKHLCPSSRVKPASVKSESSKPRVTLKKSPKKPKAKAKKENDSESEEVEDEEEESEYED